MVSVTDYRLYPAIQGQPSECAKVLGSVQPFDHAAETLSGASRVWTVGIGTSFNAANVASWMLRAAGLEARPLTSFESHTPGARPTAGTRWRSASSAVSRSC